VLRGKCPSATKPCAVLQALTGEQSTSGPAAHPVIGATTAHARPLLFDRYPELQGAALAPCCPALRQSLEGGGLAADHPASANSATSSAATPATAITGGTAPDSGDGRAGRSQPGVLNVQWRGGGPDGRGADGPALLRCCCVPSGRWPLTWAEFPRQNLFHRISSPRSGGDAQLAPALGPMPRFWQGAAQTPRFALGRWSLELGWAWPWPCLLNQRWRGRAGAQASPLLPWALPHHGDGPGWRLDLNDPKRSRSTA